MRNRKQCRKDAAARQTVPAAGQLPVEDRKDKERQKNEGQDEYIFIVRCGEVALKGMNKPYFERMLLERIKKLLKKFDGVRAYRHEGRQDIYYQDKIPGFGGLPLGTNGKGMTLLSGGIDSPVATWMMAKRGMLIEAVHFHSYPYTSQRAREKVEELASLVATYCGRFRMHVINLLPIQEQIVTNCPEEETTILVRRFMMRIAEELAKANGCNMLITGENLGQVASQTAEALVVTDASVQMPVMRPLIGMDKVDIMDLARRSEPTRSPSNRMRTAVRSSFRSTRRRSRSWSGSWRASRSWTASSSSRMPSRQRRS